MARLGRKWARRDRDFFRLQEPHDTLTTPEEFFKLLDASGGRVENILYRPDSLRGSTEKFPRKIENVTFRNVSFTRTQIEKISFHDCVFDQCLFIGTQIKNCEFHDCKFIDSNTHKIGFERVYINPKSFKNCLKSRSDQNIGVHLYQRLLRNSNNESQREFARVAAFQLNLWKGNLSLHDSRENFGLGYKKTIKSIKLFFVFLGLYYWGSVGAGVYMTGLANLLFNIIIVTSGINYLFRKALGLDDIINFIDSIYFTMITFATIGYGDITPSNSLGKIVIALEGFLGFFLLVLVASLAVERIKP